MNNLKSAILAATILAACGTAQAQHLGSSTIPAQATVPIECRLTLSKHLEFPNYDTVNNPAGSVPTSRASIFVICTANASVTMQIGAGRHPSLGSCGDYRRMKHTQSDHYLAYTLMNPLATGVWNSYNPGKCEYWANQYVIYGPRNGVTVSFTARLKAYQYTAPIGLYSDSLTVYLNF